MWAAAEVGIMMISKNGEFRLYGDNDGLPPLCAGVRIALDTNGYPAAVLQDTAEDAFYLSQYDGQSWHTIPFPFDWLDEDGKEMWRLIRCMAIDPRGHAWFGTLYGALEFDGSVTVLHSRENSDIAGNNVYKMKLDSTGRLWFVCYGSAPGYGGLCFYDGEHWGSMPGMDYPDVTGLAITFDGTLGVGRTEGLIVSEPGDLPTIHLTDNPDIGRPSGDPAWGPDGTMFIADAAKGLWRYQNDSWDLTTSEEGLATDSAVAVAVDSKGVVWSGAYGAGVTRWEGDTFTVFTVEDGLATNSVVAIAIDAFDQPWVIGGGYYIAEGQYVFDYRISHYDGERWHDHTTDDGVPSVPIVIECDSRGWVWVKEWSAGGYSLYSFDGQSWRLWGTRDGFFKEHQCYGWLCCDSNGTVFTFGYTELWPGSRRYRIAIFDGSTWTQYPLSEYVSNGAVDAAGRLWLCAGYGASLSGLRLWDTTGSESTLNVQNGDIADNGWSMIACSPEGDIYGRNIAGIERHYLNPNVIAVANGESFAPGDTLTLKYWAENPGGADRELDLYVLVTLPTGDSVYLPTLFYDRVVYQTITIPKETTQNPVEFLTLDLPDDLPMGDYTITPWFTDHGSTEQTGQCTPVTFTIADRP